MKPFRVPNEIHALINLYPDAELIRNAALNGGEASRIAISRLWLSEGIPYAFRDCPGIYESMRTWLGARIGVEPKNISLTGSARIGQSLSPKKIGQPFGKHSDLDLFVISPELFNKMRVDFTQWSYDYESGKLEPLNQREMRFWDDHLNRIPKLIQRGFLHSTVVPNRDAYATFTGLAQSMYLLKEKLSVTQGAPAISKASIRCYKSWGDFIQQSSLSLAAG